MFNFQKTQIYISQVIILHFKNYISCQKIHFNFLFQTNTTLGLIFEMIFFLSKHQHSLHGKLFLVIKNSSLNDNNFSQMVFSNDNIFIPKNFVTIFVTINGAYH